MGDVALPDDCKRHPKHRIGALAVLSSCRTEGGVIQRVLLRYSPISAAGLSAGAIRQNWSAAAWAFPSARII